MKTIIVPIALVVAAFVAVPLGYAQTQVLAEDFSTWPPAGWTLSWTGCGGWVSPDLATYPNYTGGSGAYAAANSDGCGGALDAQLVSPPFALPGGTTGALLTFKHDFYCGTFTGDQAAVEISTDGGSGWSQLAQYTGAPVRGPLDVAVDLMPWASSPSLQLRFHFTASAADWWWQIDEVRVTAFACPAPVSPHVSGDTTACQGLGASLSTETYAAYQWQKDGTDIPGATGQGFTATESGAYGVTATDAHGCRGTSEALQVNFVPGSPAPSISAGSESCSGGGVLLTATGGGPFQSYQWYVDAHAIPGETGATHYASQTGEYAVDGVNADGCRSTSPPATITVAAPPVITNQPQDQAVSTGESAFLDVFVAGAGPFTYQWYVGSSGDVADPITDATGPTFATPPLTSTTSYWVRVWSGSCSVDSITATVSVGEEVAVPALGTAGVLALAAALAAIALFVRRGRIQG